MEHRIFYSWQSDLDAALTRNFIEEALNKAAKKAARDEAILIEPVVDRDTVGVIGAQGIADTIFQKIDVSDVFVCDVSIINGFEAQIDISLFQEILRAAAQIILKRTSGNSRERRLTPNPNVLAELGYAAARLGWGRIILIQNTAFGKIEDLPFDLRGRRLVTYHISSREERADHRAKLRSDLESALTSAFGDMLKPTPWAGLTVPRWFGYWKTPQNPARGNTLFIREVSAKGFFFEIQLYDGARSGYIYGRASILSTDLAYACIHSLDEQEPCELKFRRSLGDVRKIEIEEAGNCYYFMGMGASFSGIYEAQQNHLFDCGFLDELDLQRLYGITGQYFPRLIELCGQIGDFDSLEHVPSKVIQGGHKGMYTICEAIVMKNDKGALWTAFLYNNIVRYFTTQIKEKHTLPKTFEKWRERFAHARVIFVDDVETIDDIF
ncbi:MAG: hypothetical protein ABF443_04180 [Acetobacter malorum]|uniref:hypothetical protein n=1 Tax=Acetobacter malorum TaxID=178901 RepID=UPI0039EB3495